MKWLTKKYSSPDGRQYVEVRQKRENLFEVEGFRQVTESLPEIGDYVYMEPFLGGSLTDSPEIAEKIALDTLAVLSGVSREQIAYQVTISEEEVPAYTSTNLEPQKSHGIPRQDSDDPRFKDMKSWGVDKDYTPIQNPSLERKDLIHRARKVLEKITKGGKSIYSVEVCEMLILIGKSLDRHGASVDACRYWYNASEIANNPWLGGWGTVASELLRETQRSKKIADARFSQISPIPDLLYEFIEDTDLVK